MKFCFFNQLEFYWNSFALATVCFIDLGKLNLLVISLPWSKLVKQTVQMISFGLILTSKRRVWSRLSCNILIIKRLIWSRLIFQNLFVRQKENFSFSNFQWKSLLKLLVFLMGKIMSDITRSLLCYQMSRGRGNLSHCLEKTSQYATKSINH
jgi:hypothetical protein